MRHSTTCLLRTNILLDFRAPNCDDGMVVEHPSEIFRLMEFATLERARAIAAANERFEERMKGLRAVRDLLKLREETPVPEPVPRKRGDVVTRVKFAVAHAPEVFSLGDLTKLIRERDEVGDAITTKAISSAINRLVGTQVELIERGKGKRGSKFRRITRAS